MEIKKHNKNITNEKMSDFFEGQKVTLSISRQTEMGFIAVINGTHRGILYKNEVFQPGTFIIPFNGDELLDKKIISIFTDYNYTHELHKNQTKKVNLSMILQPFNLE